MEGIRFFHTICMLNLHPVEISSVRFESISYAFPLIYIPVMVVIEMNLKLSTGVSISISKKNHCIGLALFFFVTPESQNRLLHLNPVLYIKFHRTF